MKKPKKQITQAKLSTDNERSAAQNADDAEDHSKKHQDPNKPSTIPSDTFNYSILDHAGKDYLFSVEN